MYLDYLSQLEQTINKTRKLCSSADFAAANKELHEISKLLKVKSFYATVSEVHGIVAERNFHARFNIALHSYYGLINKVYISEAYQLIEDCNRSILQADLTQAALNHGLAIKKMEVLDRFYGHAVQKGIQKTATYIHMPEEFHYLCCYLQQVEANYIQTIVSGLCKTLNFYPRQGEVSVAKNKHSQFGAIGEPRRAEPAVASSTEENSEETVSISI